jgi:hypothetical protein
MVYSLSPSRATIRKIGLSEMISSGRRLVCFFSLANMIRSIGAGGTDVSVLSVGLQRNGSTFPHRCDGTRAWRPWKLLGM